MTKLIDKLNLKSEIQSHVRENFSQLETYRQREKIRENKNIVNSWHLHIYVYINSKSLNLIILCFLLLIFSSKSLGRLLILFLPLIHD